MRVRGDLLCVSSGLFDCRLGVLDALGEFVELAALTGGCIGEHLQSVLGLLCSLRLFVNASGECVDVIVNASGECADVIANTSGERADALVNASRELVEFGTGPVAL